MCVCQLTVFHVDGRFVVQGTFIVDCRGPVALERVHWSVVMNATRKNVRGTTFCRVFGFRAV